MPYTPLPGTSLDRLQTHRERWTLRKALFKLGSTGDYREPASTEEAVKDAASFLCSYDGQPSTAQRLLDLLIDGKVIAEADTVSRNGRKKPIVLRTSFWRWIRNNPLSIVWYTGIASDAKGVEYEDIRCRPFDIARQAGGATEANLPPENAVLRAIHALRPEVTDGSWSREAIKARAQERFPALSERDANAVATALLPDEKRSQTGKKMAP